jgi:hypothetical protein
MSDETDGRAAIRRAHEEIDKLPGMKERELAALGACPICGKGQLEGRGITGYVVTVSRIGLVRRAVERRAGLAMMLGSDALAGVMGPDEDLAKIVDGPTSVYVHEACAGLVGHLLELVPSKG